MTFVFNQRDVPDHPDLGAMIKRLAAGEVVSDHDFDRLYPKVVQKLSRTHWTPLAVAEMATQWLSRSGADRILDVGSGVGKFCLIGGLTTAASYVGMETQPGMVQLSKALLRRYKIGKVQFRVGDATAASWDTFTGAYLYNPFSQRFTFQRGGASSQAVASDLYDSQGRLVYDLLEQRPAGFRVAVYCGYGRGLPPQYTLVAVELFGAGPLELWEKTQ